MRTSVWVSEARRHLLPRLPGSWIVTRQGVVVQRPVGLVLRGAAFQGRPGGSLFYMRIIGEPLWAGPPHLASYSIRLGLPSRAPGGFRVWSTTEEAEEVFGDVAERILEEVVPHCAMVDTPERLLARMRLQDLTHQSPNPHVLYDIAGGEALCGLPQAALRTLTRLQDVAEEQDLASQQWGRELLAKAATLAEQLTNDPTEAVRPLHAHAEWRRAQLHIPLDA